MYSCTAVGPMMFKMSLGVTAPSDKGIPAFTKSLSCTRMCFDNGTMYLNLSPVRASTITSRLPRLILP